MMIVNANNDLIVGTGHKTERKTLEYCAAEGVALNGANLRRGKLNGAALDGLIAPGANFWGADLSSADLADADLKRADLRGANLKGACLAGTDLTSADLRGACFDGTTFEDAVLDFVSVSCPTLWRCDLRSCRSMKGLTYWHRGETALVLDRPPLVIEGVSRRLVVTESFCLWGHDLLRDANYPMPKIGMDTHAF